MVSVYVQFLFIWRTLRLGCSLILSLRTGGNTFIWWIRCWMVNSLRVVCTMQLLLLQCVFKNKPVFAPALLILLPRLTIFYFKHNIQVQVEVVHNLTSTYRLHQQKSSMSVHEIEAMTTWLLHFKFFPSEQTARYIEMGIVEYHRWKWRCILLFQRCSRGYRSLQLLIMR